MLPLDVIDGLHINPLTIAGSVMFLVTFLITMAAPEKLTGGGTAIAMIGLISSAALIGGGPLIDHYNKIDTVVLWAETKYNIQIPESQNEKLVGTPRSTITLEDGTQLTLDKADNGEGYLLYDLTKGGELTRR